MTYKIYWLMIGPNGSKSVISLREIKWQCKDFEFTVSILMGSPAKEIINEKDDFVEKRKNLPMQSGFLIFMIISTSLHCMRVFIQSEINFGHTTC